MKITATSRYALRILLDIAVHADGGTRTIREISESQSISEKFISRIVVSLRRAGFLASERGMHGGLRLARFPEHITLLDIMEATEGSVGILACLVAPGTCPRQGHCAAECAWRGVNDALLDALRKTTLADVVAKQGEFVQADGAEPDYCI